MRIFLVGYMGSGKSTVSKKLGSMLGLESYDLDQLFEEKYKIDISGFFAKYGEQSFRSIESQLLKETNLLENAVIATGGGTACFYDNMDWMNKNGITIYLQLHPVSIVNRLQFSKKKRPLIASKSADELLVFVREHMRQRNIYYSQAQIIYKGESADLESLSLKIKQLSKNNS